MVRIAHDRVRLAPADWGGLISVALTLAALMATAIHEVHTLAMNSRVRMTRLETEIAHLKSEVALLQADVRAIARGGR